MNRNAICGIMLMLLSIGVLGLVFHVQPVKAIGAIYIRADGSIDPPEAPIVTVDSVTYVLTGNLGFNDHIVIERANIIVDGNGYTLQPGYMVDSAFYWSGVGNITIKNTRITYAACGVWIQSSNYNTVAGNTIEVITGILLDSSSFTEISGNTIDAPTGIELDSSNHNSISGNMIANGGYHGVWFYLSSYNNLTENTITNSYIGIYMQWSMYNRFHYNNFTENTHQVDIFESPSNHWNASYPSGGNYWSDYTDADLYKGPNQNITGSDGIWDHAYVMDADNIDYYPLANPYVPVTGDVNGDRKVDVKDLVLVIKAFGSYPSHPDWNPNADINSDGKVDVKDLVLLIKHFGEHYP